MARRHDDVHFPMGGKGKRGSRRYASMPPRATLEFNDRPPPTVVCPECKGEAFLHSSGDGWDEWDECQCCNPDGENVSGMVTPERLTKYRADRAAEDARIDAMAEQDFRKPE